MYGVSNGARIQNITQIISAKDAVERKVSQRKPPRLHGKRRWRI